MSINDSRYSCDLQDYLDLLAYDSATLMVAEKAASVEANAEAKGEAEASPSPVPRSEVQIMFVGEALVDPLGPPNGPLSGPAGQLLEKMIGAMGYQRHDVYITNLSVSEAPNSYRAVLIEEINAVRPTVIVTMGPFANQILLASESDVAELRAQRWEKEFGDLKLPVFPTFHPSYLLRNAERKKDVWEDLKLVMAHLRPN